MKLFVASLPYTKKWKILIEKFYRRVLKRGEIWWHFYDIRVYSVSIDANFVLRFDEDALNLDTGFLNKG